MGRLQYPDRFATLDGQIEIDPLISQIASIQDTTYPQAENPVSPKDILASIFHLLGIDAHTTIPDRLGRPLPIAGTGVVRPELFA